MRTRTLRSIALLVGWLLTASFLIAVPHAEAADESTQWPQSPSRLEYALSGEASTGQYATSAFLQTGGALAFAPPGSHCEVEDPDTGVIETGTIEVRQVGRDHNQYDGDGRFNDSDSDIIAQFHEDLLDSPSGPLSHYSTPPGYRWEVEVCMSDGWPSEPLQVAWSDEPFKLVLAENAVEWFETVKDEAFEKAFENKVPGWRIWPDRGFNQVVNLDSWLFIENYFGVLSSSRVLNADQGDPIQVSVEAVPTHSEWWLQLDDIGFERTITCTEGGGQGVAWTPGATGDKCDLDWDHSTPVVGQGELRVRLIYDVTVTSSTLTDDEANSEAGQVFTETILGHPGDWDVHEDASVPDDYKLTIAEVLTFGFDQTGEFARPADPVALGATPGGEQIGPSEGCWGPDAVCRVVVAVGGAIANFILPEEFRSLLQGCWEGAKDAAIGFGDLLSNLLPGTWQEKWDDFTTMTDTLWTAYNDGNLVEVLADMGAGAAFDALHLEIFDKVGDGNWSDLEFGTLADWTEWIGTVACEYLIGSVTGRAQQQFDDLLFGANKKNNENDGDNEGENDNDGENDDDERTDDEHTDDEHTDDENDDERTDDEEDTTPVCPFGRNSFRAGTAVLMADGTHQAIDLIEPGDRVMAYDLANQQWRAQTVLDQWSALDIGHMTTLTLVDGATIDATDHHRFWVESEHAWVTIESLDVGDVLLTPAGEVSVASVFTDDFAFTPVYELTVSQDHNFTVQAGTHDVLVHNNDGDGCGDKNPDGTWKREEVPDGGNVVKTDADGNPIIYEDENGDWHDLRPKGELDERAQEILDGVINNGDEPVLGRQPDTEAAGAEDGVWHLDEDDWSPELNDAVMDGLIDDGKPITLVSDPDGDIAGSIYEQELSKLQDDNGWQVTDNGDGTWTAEPSWGNTDTLQGHFDDHGGDFGHVSPGDYAQDAGDFFDNRTSGDIEVKIDPDTGDIRVYDPNTNTFGSYGPDGMTSTFFKPDRGLDYWNDQPG